MNKKHISAFTGIMLILTFIFVMCPQSNKAIVGSLDKVCATTSEDSTTENDTSGRYTTDIEPDAPDIVAEAAIVIDADTGNILYQKNAYECEYPASITKIMTCLLAIENCEMDETVTMSYDAIWGIDRDSNNIALDVGEELLMEDCLYALMLESANEVAWGIGEHITGGDIEAFAEMMTEKAYELGCKDTNFKNANGLPDEDHYTTCYDMALITQAALQYEAFRTITSTLTYTIGPTNLCDEERVLWQHCKLIRIDHTYSYEYCEGGKTGYTIAANNTLVSWSKKDDREIICVIMNCDGTSNTYTDTINLSNYCFENFTDITPPEASYEFVKENEDQIIENFYKYYDYYDSADVSVELDSSYKLAYSVNWDTADISYSLFYTGDSSCITYNEETDTYTVAQVAFYHGNNLIGYGDILLTGYDPDAATTEEKAVSAYSASPSDAENNSTDNEKSGIHISGKFIIIFIVVLIVMFAILFAIYVRHVNETRMRNRKRREEEINRRR